MTDHQTALLARLFARTSVGWVDGMDTPCILWDGALDRYGYGQVRVRCPDGVWRTKTAHRTAYRLVLGEDPPLPLDHLCRVRRCVNPFHLEPVPSAVNTWRGTGRGARGKDTHCQRGHEFTDENTIYRERNGRLRRECVTCRRARRKAY
jgi:hypothetical protein